MLIALKRVQREFIVSERLQLVSEVVPTVQRMNIVTEGKKISLLCFKSVTPKW